MGDRAKQRRFARRTLVALILFSFSRLKKPPSRAPEQAKGHVQKSASKQTNKNTNKRSLLFIGASNGQDSHRPTHCAQNIIFHDWSELCRASHRHLMNLDQPR